MEHIRGINWDFDGVQLSHVQTIQRIITAGFPIWKADPQPHSPALDMFAIVEGESGEYTRAWHANVVREEDGTISRFERDGKTYMRVKSVDLGFMQFNTDVFGDWVEIEMTQDAVAQFIDTMFDENPDLGRADLAAKRAFTLWKQRGFQPWFGYKPGTPEFRKKKRYGAIAFAQWLVNSFVGKDPDTNKVPQVGYK